VQQGGGLAAFLGVPSDSQDKGQPAAKASAPSMCVEEVVLVGCARCKVVQAHTPGRSCMCSVSTEGAGALVFLPLCAGSYSYL
jgi:hypothetical protein